MHLINSKPNGPDSNALLMSNLKKCKAMARTKNFQLTENYSYYEMTRSAWAERNRVKNIPDSLQLAALENLCRKVLEPMHQQFGKITIGSAFRNERVNQGVHGVGASLHLRGEAVDICFPDEQTGLAYFCFIKSHCDIDQLLFEYNRSGAMWIHVSTCLDPRENRHMVFPNYLPTYE